MLLNLERARDKMDAQGIDALVASVARNVYYASGFWTRISEWGFQEPQATVIIPRDPDRPATLVVPEFAIAGLLETPTWIPQVRVTEFLNTSYIAREPEPVRLDPLQADMEKLYAEKVVGDLAPDIVAGTRTALADLGLGGARVGFDDIRLAQHVAKDLSGLHVVDAHDLWLDIRKVKTAQEIEFLRHGARLNEAGLNEIIPTIRPGVVWRDVAGRFRQYIQEHGANLLSAQKALQFGAEYGGEYFPDLMFADNDWRVREGQTIIFESWGTYSNYAFDVSRTVHVGEPSAEYRRICATISAAQQEAVQHLRAGVTTHEAWSAIAKLAYAMDVPTPKKTLVFMHSIGLDIIELPSSYPAFGRLKDFELEPDTVINFEFLYFGHSVAPYHLESSYLIRDGEPECLHTLPQELIVVA
ncbi:MAG TPA: M24 family metallopeptidase [Steroidobacteraceae bacterium]|nr:M24 family metallopeptidase [Steroidobacteraceae bacterium]